MSAGVMTSTRTAASSIASGTPSRRRQISWTAGVDSGSSANSGSTLRARSANSDIASVAGSSGRTGTTCSPPRSSASRLVASTTTWGQRSSTASARSAAASSTCSQLSSTMMLRVAPRWSHTTSMSARPGCTAAPSARATTATTALGSPVRASSTNHAPPGNTGSASTAACSARRVLPTPPTPVRVRSLCWPMSSRTRASSRFAADERAQL